MQATVNDDGLSFMFTVTERKIISDALEQEAERYKRRSRIRAYTCDRWKGHRAYLRKEAKRRR